jgi:hypothetical protein
MVVILAGAAVVKMPAGTFGGGLPAPAGRFDDSAHPDRGAGAAAGDRHRTAVWTRTSAHLSDS